MRKLIFLLIGLCSCFVSSSQSHNYTFCYGNISVTIFDEGRAEMVRYSSSGTPIKTVSGEYGIYGKGGPTEVLKIQFEGNEYRYDLIRDGNGTPSVIFDSQGRKYELCNKSGVNSNSNGIDFNKTYTSNLPKVIKHQGYKISKTNDGLFLITNSQTNKPELYLATEDQIFSGEHKSLVYVEATDSVKRLNIRDKRNWRIPSFSELEIIYGFVSQGIISSSSSMYWSSTINSNDIHSNQYLKCIDFSNGNIVEGRYYPTNQILSYGKENDGRVFAVREINPNNKIDSESKSLVSFIDSRDGHKYKSIRIGNQIWMAENLAYLPAFTYINVASINRPCYYIYDNTAIDIKNAILSKEFSKYGVLYNWEAAKISCPSGWHLPSKYEYDILIKFLVDNNLFYGADKDYLGKSLASPSGWRTFNTYPGRVGKEQFKNNLSGLNILPSGYFRYSAAISSGSFNNINEVSYLWTADQKDNEQALIKSLYYDREVFATEEVEKNYGVCVRCLLDSLSEVELKVREKIEQDCRKQESDLLREINGLINKSKQKEFRAKIPNEFLTMKSRNGFSEIIQSSTFHVLRLYEQLEAICDIIKIENIDGPNTVRDIDGNVYHSIKIGNQIWMAENLKTTKYRNGDPLFEVKKGESWRAKFYNGAYCYYNSEPTNGSIYGLLYNWNAINDPRNIAPSGWHVPSETDWSELINYLGGEKIAGGKLKEIGTDHWTTPNLGANNKSGFTALPGGYRTDEGSFEDEPGNFGFWWTSSSSFSVYSWSISLHYDGFQITKKDRNIGYGMYVRCIKDN